MPHAMLVKASIVPGRREESIRSLNEHTIPWVKQVSGFISGTWFGDDKYGYGLVLFTSEEQARHAASMVSAEAGDPVQIESVTVYEVTAQVG